MSRTFRTRLSEQIAGQLVELCDLSQRTMSAVIRTCVECALRDPELLYVLMTPQHTTAADDPRTPEQVAAWEANRERLTTPLQL